MNAATAVVAARCLLHDWAFRVEAPTQSEVADTISDLAERLGQGDRSVTQAVQRALWSEWLKIASAPLAVELLLSRIDMDHAER